MLGNKRYNELEFSQQSGVNDTARINKNNKILVIIFQSFTNLKSPELITLLIAII